MVTKILNTLKALIKEPVTYLFLIAMPFLYMACAGPTPQKKPKAVTVASGTKYTYGYNYDFRRFTSKTVETIEYCVGCGPSGDILFVKFTDGSKLKVYAYKYTMRIYQ